MCCRHKTALYRTRKTPLIRTCETYFGDRTMLVKNHAPLTKPHDARAKRCSGDPLLLSKPVNHSAKKTGNLKCLVQKFAVANILHDPRHRIDAFGESVVRRLIWSRQMRWFHNATLSYFVFFLRKLGVSHDKQKTLRRSKLKMGAKSCRRTEISDFAVSNHCFPADQKYEMTFKMLSCA